MCSKFSLNNESTLYLNFHIIFFFTMPKMSLAKMRDGIFQELIIQSRKQVNFFRAAYQICFHSRVTPHYFNNKRMLISVNGTERHLAFSSSINALRNRVVSELFAACSVNLVVSTVYRLISSHLEPVNTR